VLNLLHNYKCNNPVQSEIKICIINSTEYLKTASTIKQQEEDEEENKNCLCTHMIL
jgi:hypothetical protein